MNLEEAIKVTTVCIPVYNAPEHVERLLHQIEATEASKSNKIWSDDASQEETSMIIKKFMYENPHVNNMSYLRHNIQQTFSRNINRALRSSQGDIRFYVLLNTDVEVFPGWLSVMLNKLLESPEIGIVGYPDGKSPGTPDAVDNYIEISGNEYIEGHCLTVKREVFEKIGVLCETDLNMHHIVSDGHLSREAMKAGFRCFKAHYPFTIHDSGGASWKRDLGWLSRFDKSQLWEGRDRL